MRPYLIHSQGARLLLDPSLNTLAPPFCLEPLNESVQPLTRQQTPGEWQQQENNECTVPGGNYRDIRMEIKLEKRWIGMDFGDFFFFHSTDCFSRGKVNSNRKQLFKE